MNCNRYLRKKVSLLLFFVNSLMIIGYTFAVILLAYWLGIFISELFTLPAGYRVKTSLSKNKMQECSNWHKAIDLVVRHKCN